MHGGYIRRPAINADKESPRKALNKDGSPSFGTVLKVMQALGIKLTPRTA